MTSPRADLQKSDVQFTRAKGFDTFCPVGPYIETEFESRGCACGVPRERAVRQSARDVLNDFLAGVVCAGFRG